MNRRIILSAILVMWCLSFFDLRYKKTFKEIQYLGPNWQIDDISKHPLIAHPSLNPDELPNGVKYASWSELGQVETIHLNGDIPPPSHIIGGEIIQQSSPLTLGVMPRILHLGETCEIRGEWQPSTPAKMRVEDQHFGLLAERANLTGDFNLKFQPKLAGLYSLKVTIESENWKETHSWGLEVREAEIPVVLGLFQTSQQARNLKKLCRKLGLDPHWNTRIRPQVWATHEGIPIEEQLQQSWALLVLEDRIWQTLGPGLKALILEKTAQGKITLLWTRLANQAPFPVLQGEKMKLEDNSYLARPYGTDSPLAVRNQQALAFRKPHGQGWLASTSLEKSLHSQLSKRNWEIIFESFDLLPNKPFFPPISQNQLAPWGTWPTEDGWNKTKDYTYWVGKFPWKTAAVWEQKQSRERGRIWTESNKFPFAISLLLGLGALFFLDRRREK